MKWKRSNWTWNFEPLSSVNFGCRLDAWSHQPLVGLEFHVRHGFLCILAARVYHPPSWSWKYNEYNVFTSQFHKRRVYPYPRRLKVIVCIYLQICHWNSERFIFAWPSVCLVDVSGQEDPLIGHGSDPEDWVWSMRVFPFFSFSEVSYVMQETLRNSWASLAQIDLRVGFAICS